MSNFAQIDLSQLPAPSLIEELSYERILSEMAADYLERNPDTTLLESDPAMKVLETAAFRELLLRQDINERARQCLLAYAAGSNLEHLGAFYGVARALLDAGDENAIPPVPPTYEPDASLRGRIQLAPEALSVAGPTRAYVFHALSAGRQMTRMEIDTPTAETVTVTYTFGETKLSALAKDASAVSPVPGDVVVAVLGRAGDGTASPELLAAVDDALQDEFVRPLTDRVTIQGAEIIPYTVEAVLEIPPGPDPSIIETAARSDLSTYIDSAHRLSGIVARSGLDRALHTAGVVRVVLNQPATDILCSALQAPACQTINLSVKIIGSAQ